MKDTTFEGGGALKSNTPISSNIEKGIKNISAGNSIQRKTQVAMEADFGTDFSDVKIHTDDQAVKMNKTLGAKAFTYGRDIFFNKGMYNPESRDGKQLLAHELTHTIQQNSKVVPSIQRDLLDDMGDGYESAKETVSNAGQAILDTGASAVGAATETASNAYNSAAQAGGEAAEWAAEKRKCRC